MNYRPINDVSSILKSFHQQDIELPSSSRRTCITPMKRIITGSSTKLTKSVNALYYISGALIVPENETSLDPTVEMNRNKRHVFSFSEDFDAYDTFSVSSDFLYT